MYKNREKAHNSVDQPGVKVFDLDTPEKTDVRQTGLPTNFRDLDKSTKTSLVHSSYFREHDIEAHDRREQFIHAHNADLQAKNYPRSEKPYFDFSKDLIKFSTRGEEDINFRMPRTETLQRLTWSTMERDLPAWDVAVKLLAQTSGMDDDTFRVEVAPQISNLLLQESPLFQHLASGEIDVSDSHRKLNKTPFLHTFDVLMAVETDDLRQNKERFLLRFHALFHDIGKAIIANHDHFQDHGAFSQSMLMEYAVRMWKMSPLEAYQVTQIERWHHASENVNKKYITNEEILLAINEIHDVMVPALPVFSQDEIYRLLMELNQADTESVQELRFMLEAAEVSLEGVYLLITRLKDIPHALQQWLVSLAEDGMQYIEQLNLPYTEKRDHQRKVAKIVYDAARNKNLDSHIQDQLIDVFVGNGNQNVAPKGQTTPNYVVNPKQLAIAA